jgi:hypothetical protein
MHLDRYNIQNISSRRVHVDIGFECTPPAAFIGEDKILK